MIQFGNQEIILHIGKVIQLKKEILLAVSIFVRYNMENYLTFL
jgi:hypothetical protein